MLTLGTDMIVGAVPPERAGSASAVSETSFELGGALGVAILGSIGTAIYRGQVADTVPAGVSPATAEAARDTLGGTRELTGPQPAGVDAELLAAAQDAFVQGFQAAAMVSAAIALAVAVIGLRMLRQTRSASGMPDGKSDVVAPPGASAVSRSPA